MIIIEQSLDVGLTLCMGSIPFCLIRKIKLYTYEICIPITNMFSLCILSLGDAVKIHDEVSLVVRDKIINK